MTATSTLLDEHGLATRRRTPHPSVSVSAGGTALFANAPKLPARSTVGSGDSALAGFAFAAQQRLSPVEAVRLAVACGSANCLAAGPGCARAEDIASVKDQIHVEKLS